MLTLIGLYTEEQVRNSLNLSLIYTHTEKGIITKMFCWLQDILVYHSLCSVVNNDSIRMSTTSKNFLRWLSSENDVRTFCVKNARLADVD